MLLKTGIFRPDIGESARKPSFDGGMRHETRHCPARRYEINGPTQPWKSVPAAGAVRSYRHQPHTSKGIVMGASRTLNATAGPATRMTRSILGAAIALSADARGPR